MARTTEARRAPVGNIMGRFATHDLEAFDRHVQGVWRQVVLQQRKPILRSEIQCCTCLLHMTALCARNIGLAEMRRSRLENRGRQALSFLPVMMK